MKIDSSIYNADRELYRNDDNYQLIDYEKEVKKVYNKATLFNPDRAYVICSDEKYGKYNQISDEMSTIYLAWYSAYKKLEKPV